MSPLEYLTRAAAGLGLHGVAAPDENGIVLRALLIADRFEDDSPSLGAALHYDLAQQTLAAVVGPFTRFQQPIDDVIQLLHVANSVNRFPYLPGHLFVHEHGFFGYSLRDNVTPEDIVRTLPGVYTVSRNLGRNAERVLVKLHLGGQLISR